MGITDSGMNLALMTSGISDYEYMLQNIATQRANMALQAQQVAETNPDQSDQLHVLDTQLEVKQKAIETQLKMLTTQYDSVKKFITDDIERSFKYNA